MPMHGGRRLAATMAVALDVPAVTGFENAVTCASSEIAQAYRSPSPSQGLGAAPQ